MNIDITRLRSGIVSKIDINETYSFSEEELKTLEITSLDDLKITGTVSLDALKDVYLDLEVTGTMIIPCAITLKPVNYPFNINIEGTIEEIAVDLEKKVEKNQNILDIFPIIWENVLMEVPMRVVADDADDYQISGDGWSFNNDDSDQGNSELSKLKDLL